MDTLSRIIGPVNIANGDSVIFTGSDNQVYTFLDLRIVNNTGAGVTVKLGINGIADSNLVIPQTTINSHATLTDLGRIILSGAETLNANASATGTTITVNGLIQTI